MSAAPADEPAVWMREPSSTSRTPVAITHWAKLNHGAKEAGGPGYTAEYTIPLYRAAPAAPAGEPLRDALTELLAIKDLKVEIAFTDYSKAEPQVLDALRADYERREFLAWQIARKAIAAPAGERPER